MTKINQELSQLNKQLEPIIQIQEVLENYQIAKELADIESQQILNKEIFKLLSEVQNILLFDGKYDDRGVIMSLYAGAGGVDAQDWTRMLLHAYQTFAKKMSWESELVNLSLSEEGGVKSVTLEISGYNVYGYLQTEIGVHRLVRISPFNSGGTRETSFAQVEILPKDLDKDLEMAEIQESDLKWDYFMSSGKGGQSVNTTYSAVRLSHLPTKTVVTCQNQRDQQQNKAQALKYLKNKLAAIEIQKKQEHQTKVRGELKANEFGSQIRNYVLHPYKMIKDLRSGFEITDIDSVLVYGDFLPLIISVKKSKI
jgi:peptide chain release factor 2